MRTTINLDSDSYNFASAYAGGKGITLSAAINELVRHAERITEKSNSLSRLEMNEFGYYEIADSGELITSEMVKAGSEDELG